LLNPDFTMKVYDCITFFNEIELLKIRMKILSPIVDCFVISEATHTFSGKPKELILLSRLDEFSEFKDKILYKPVMNMPLDTDNWGREIHQRNASKEVLLANKCKDEDIIISGDLDEIPNLVGMENWYYPGEIFHPLMRMFYYGINIEKLDENNWLGTVICNYGFMKDKTIDQLRNMKSQGMQYLPGGWHFTYLNNPDGIRKKIEAFSHQEFNNDGVKNGIEGCVKELRDPFGRVSHFEVHHTFEDYPEYIREHLDEMDRLGFIWKGS